MIFPSSRLTLLLDRRKKIIILILLACFALAIWAGDHRRRWVIYLETTGVPNMHDLPSDRTGYTVEELPFEVGASYARNHSVYFVDHQGRVFATDDREPVSAPRRLLGDSQIAPRMLFVTARGTIFVSGLGFPTVRSVDGGKSWRKSHDLSVWRMTEDERSHAIYAGVYTRKNRPTYVAKLLQSTDEGQTWQTIFEDRRLDHIHSVRWDSNYNRLYLSAGDGARRGQAYSDDGGKTWHWINSGGKQGHTDVAFSERYVFWGSDDNLGRILRAPRSAVQDGQTILWAADHHVWWLIAYGRQVYAGTLTGERKKNTGAYLLASADEGATWQKLLEDSDGGAALGSFQAESRELSADGWLYCSTMSGKAYRIRRSPKI
jgi:photosystem II stability/assembly factor-like uncharacterized protein